MTTPLVAPLALPRIESERPPGDGAGRRPVPAGFRRIPMPALAPARERRSVYGFATVNDRGRIIAQQVMDALGWSPGMPVTIRRTASLILVTADPAGMCRVTGEGHLRIPASVRQWCGLDPQSRVLLVGDPGLGRLVIHPPASLDAMINQAHTAALRGDAL